MPQRHLRGAVPKQPLPLGFIFETGHCHGPKGMRGVVPMDQESVPSTLSRADDLMLGLSPGHSLLLVTSNHTKRL